MQDRVPTPASAGTAAAPASAPAERKVDETSQNKNDDDGDDKKLVDIRCKNINPKIDLALTAQQYNIRVTSVGQINLKTSLP